jgi:hypothetical protein
MQANLRSFTVSDPFERSWDVEFRWHQNAISIRHADAIDCKYYLSSGGEQREIVIALPHAELLRVAEKLGRPLTDAWCMRLAARHLRHMISTWEDMDKTIAVTTPAELEAHAVALGEEDAAARERAALMR